MNATSLDFPAAIDAVRTLANLLGWSALEALLVPLTAPPEPSELESLTLLGLHKSLPIVPPWPATDLAIKSVTALSDAARWFRLYRGWTRGTARMSVYMARADEALADASRFAGAAALAHHRDGSFVSLFQVELVVP